MTSVPQSRFSVLNDEPFTNPSKKNKKKKPEAVVKPTPKKVENANTVNKKQAVPSVKPVNNQPKANAKSNQAKPQQNVAPNNANDAKKKKKVANAANAGPQGQGKKAPKQNNVNQPKKAKIVAAAAGQKKNVGGKNEKTTQISSNVNEQMKKLREEVTELKNRNSTLLSLLQTGEMKEKHELLKQNQFLSNELNKLKSSGSQKQVTVSPANVKKGGNVASPVSAGGKKVVSATGKDKSKGKPAAKQPAAGNANVSNASAKPKPTQKPPTAKATNANAAKTNTGAAGKAKPKPKPKAKPASGAGASASAAAGNKKPAKKSKN